jgi:hypothetical protein
MPHPLIFFYLIILKIIIIIIKLNFNSENGSTSVWMAPKNTSLSMTLFFLSFSKKKHMCVSESGVVPPGIATVM